MHLVINSSIIIFTPHVTSICNIFLALVEASYEYINNRKQYTRKGIFISYFVYDIQFFKTYPTEYQVPFIDLSND